MWVMELQAHITESEKRNWMADMIEEWSPRAQVWLCSNSQSSVLLMSGNAARKDLFTLGLGTTATDLLGEAKGDQRPQGYVCIFIPHSLVGF
jgi:hypothetical protein